MLESHCKLLEVRGIFWKNTVAGFLTPLPRAPCLGGENQPWPLLAGARLFLPLCRMPGREVRQHVPQDCCQRAPSGALRDKGELSRGPPRVGINTGTILAQLKAADETPGRRLVSLPGLPRTSEYHPPLRVGDRRLQGTCPAEGYLETWHAPLQQGKAPASTQRPAPAAVGL